jgi:PAS domain S-box-containing protein/diguanylate cyclase (GGDEF)-like protein
MSDAANKPESRHSRVLSVKDPQSIRPSFEAGGDAAFEQLFRGAPMAMWIYDLDTLEFVRVNRAAVERYGYPEDEFLQMRVTDLYLEEDLHRLRNHVHELRNGLPSRRRALRYWQHHLSNGETIWADTYSQPFEFQGRRCAIVSVTDATRHKQAEDHVKVQNAYFRQLFDASPEAIVVLDRDDRIVDINRRFQAVFGYEPDDLRGDRLETRLVPDFLQHEVRSSYQRRGHPGRVHERTQRAHKDGSLVDVAISSFSIEVEGTRVGTYVMYIDLREEHAAPRRDGRPPPPEAAAGMLQRAGLIAELGRLRREGIGGHSLLYVDLDQFARINQTCGHNAGDLLLLRVSETIRVRAGTAKAVYLGGDQYALLLESTDEKQAAALAREVAAGIEGIAFRWDGRVHRIGAGIGIAVIRDADISSREQLAMAETACGVAKAKGRSQLHMADTTARDVLQWEDETLWTTKVRSALKQDRFVLYAQRLTALHKHEKTPRHEILLRMLNEDGTLASPSRFLAPAARIGAVREIDDWVLDTVLRVLSSGGVREAWPGTLHLNVAEESLRDMEFGERIVEKLAAAGIAGSRLCFELSESATARNPGRARRFIGTVRAAGCEVALDNFGAEFSSLQSLRDLPVDYLKIDGALVERLNEDTANQAVIEGLGLMARQLGIKTVAAGVDNSATLECVHVLGVDFAQGYGIHQPEPFYPIGPV